jgi:hypothetical protein
MCSHERVGTVERSRQLPWVARVWVIRIGTRARLLQTAREVRSAAARAVKAGDAREPVAAEAFAERPVEVPRSAAGLHCVTDLPRPGASQNAPKTSHNDALIAPQHAAAISDPDKH